MMRAMSQLDSDNNDESSAQGSHYYEPKVQRHRAYSDESYLSDGWDDSSQNDFYPAKKQKK